MTYERCGPLPIRFRDRRTLHSTAGPELKIDPRALRRRGRRALRVNCIPPDLDPSWVHRLCTSPPSNQYSLPDTPDLIVTSAVNTFFLCSNGGSCQYCIFSTTFRIPVATRKSPKAAAAESEPGVDSAPFPVLPSGIATTDEGHAMTKLLSSNCSRLVGMFLAFPWNISHAPRRD